MIVDDHDPVQEAEITRMTRDTTAATFEHAPIGARRPEQERRA